MPLDVEVKDGKVKGVLSRYDRVLVTWTYNGSADYVQKSEGGFTFKMDFKSYSRSHMYICIREIVGRD